MVTDPELRQRLVDGGRELVSTKANLPRELKRVEALLRQAAGAR